MNIKQAPYLINKNSINWPSVKESVAKNVAQNNEWVVMHPFWVNWVNKNFKNTASGGGTWTKLVPGINSFMAKSKQQQRTPVVRFVGHEYVKVPTMRNRAAFVLKHIRERNQRIANIKAALIHAVNYEKAKKRYAGTHRFRYESPNNLGY
jgi:hypothetical protein